MANFNSIKISAMLMFFIFVSCKKKEIGPQNINDSNQDEYFFDVVIGCEGNFGFANGSVSVYNRSNFQLVNNYFDQINNFVLGDVVQFIEEINGEIFIVVNNSGKVEVVDSSDLLSKSTITGFQSPREINQINTDFAYVTDLYSNSIQLVDLHNKSIVSSIEVSGWTESILVEDTFAYVTCPDHDLVYKINTNNHLIADSLVVGDNPMNIVLDKNNQLWVLCAGSWGMNNGSLERIEITNFSHQETISLLASPSNLCKDSNGENLFWLDNGVQKMNVDQSGVINEEVSSNGKNFYGLSIHDLSGEIFVTDAVDYVQSGWVYRYSSSGALLDSINTGIIPQALFFK